MHAPPPLTLSPFSAPHTPIPTSPHPLTPFLNFVPAPAPLVHHAITSDTLILSPPFLFCAAEWATAPGSAHSQGSQEEDLVLARRTRALAPLHRLLEAWCAATGVSLSLSLSQGG